MSENAEAVGRRIILLRSPEEDGGNVVFDAGAHEPIGWHVATQGAADPPLTLFERRHSLHYYFPLPPSKAELLKKRLQKKSVLRNPLLDFGVIPVPHPDGEEAGGRLLVRKEGRVFEVLGRHVETLPLDEREPWPPLQSVKAGGSTHYFFPIPKRLKARVKRMLERKYWKRPRLFREVH
ncbi:MAG: hypothetical protein AB1626_00775 [Candidatus Micrarchaeota archaeon]